MFVRGGLLQGAVNATLHPDRLSADEGTILVAVKMLFSGVCWVPCSHALLALRTD
jgi:hypothetical protein